MRIKDETMPTMLCLHEDLGDLDYRITGLTAVNLYGYGIDTNVIDLAVESDEAVYEAVRRLELPLASPDNFNPYIYHNDIGFYVRIQGDVMGEATLHPNGLKLHSKELLVRRLEIYSRYDTCVLKALAFIALTVDDEKTEKYKYYWNRL